MKKGRLFKTACFTFAVLLVATVIVLQPVRPRKAEACPCVAVAFGLLNASIGISNATAAKANAEKSAEEMLQQIQVQLAGLQRAVDTLAMNLEIDTKEIQRYEDRLQPAGVLCGDRHRRDAGKREKDKLRRLP